MREKRRRLREKTRQTDYKILRTLSLGEDVTLKLAALLLRLHYQRIYRAMQRLRNPRRKIDKSSTEKQVKSDFKL